MNAMELRQKYNRSTTAEKARQHIDYVINCHAAEYKMQCEVRIDYHHNTTEVLESLRKDGFLAKCTLFKLHDDFFYCYDICWEKYDNEEDNEKLKQKYQQ